jgi:serine/threonine protein phosphatase PrpC
MTPPTSPPDSAAVPGLRLSVGFLSDPGRHRERNEDAFAVWIPVGPDRESTRVEACLAVADGMGGHEAGEVASRVAADAVRAAFAGPDAPRLRNGDELLGWLEQLVLTVNDRLVELGRARRLERGMGCTLTIAIVFERELYVAHVGDSRCYRLRSGVLAQLTEDHSWVAEQRRAGLLSAEEERVHPLRNVLTRCLGTNRTLDVDLTVERLEPGDRYLLCSDGLHGVLETEALRSVLAAELEPQRAVERLVSLANEAGGPDNITAALLEIGGDPSRATLVVPIVDPTIPDTQPIAPLRLPRRGRRRRFALGAALTALATASGAWLLLAVGPGVPVGNAAPDAAGSEANLEGSPALPPHQDSTRRPQQPPGATPDPPVDPPPTTETTHE